MYGFAKQNQMLRGYQRYEILSLSGSARSPHLEASFGLKQKPFLHVLVMPLIKGCLGNMLQCLGKLGGVCDGSEEMMVKQQVDTCCHGWIER